MQTTVNLTDEPFRRLSGLAEHSDVARDEAIARAVEAQPEATHPPRDHVQTPLDEMPYVYSTHLAKLKLEEFDFDEVLWG